MFLNLKNLNEKPDTNFLRNSICLEIFKNNIYVIIIRNKINHIFDITFRNLKDETHSKNQVI